MAGKDSGKRRRVKKDRPVRRMIFGLELGRNFEMVGQAARGFKHMIATIFASGGLLDADDPLVTDPPSAPRSLGRIFSTAYERVEHTREGLPKAALFYGTVGIIVGLPIALVVSLVGNFVHR